MCHDSGTFDISRDLLSNQGERVFSFFGKVDITYPIVDALELFEEYHDCTTFTHIGLYLFILSGSKHHFQASLHSFT